ncbi:MAG: PKD domain-containing protein [Candidatus Paceibacterota bacterium]
MKKINKIAVILTLAILVLVPVLALAQTALNVAITAPADGTEVVVGQSVNFTGTATGGDSSSYQFNWTWGDGTETSSGNNNGATQTTHTFSTIGAKTVELRAIDLNTNSGTKTITVNVVTGEPALVISNVRVEAADITANSAIVRWTTNKPATSRVIYDTVSRAGALNMNLAPNYGYAHFTGTVNTSPMVTEHAVTVSGLSASTQYFFRAISEVPAN